jgi:hypothetical protein
MYLIFNSRTTGSKTGSDSRLGVTHGGGAARPSAGLRSRSRPRLAFARRTPIRRILFQRIMNAFLVIVVHVIKDESTKMWFVERNDWSRISRRQLPTQRSAMPFCQGGWTLVRLGSSPVAFKNVQTSTLNFESQSRITYRYERRLERFHAVVG